MRDSSGVGTPPACPPPYHGVKDSASLSTPAPRVSIPLAILALSAVLSLSGCRKPSAPNSPPANAPQAVNVSFDPWKLVTTSPFGHHGGYLGNGFLGMRFGAGGTTDSPDGKTPAYDPKNRGRDLLCVASGFYANEHLVPAPNWGTLRFQGSNGDLFPERGDVTSYRQTLDLHRGELVTNYTVENAEPPFSVELVSRVHRDLPNLVTLSARVTPRGDGTVRVSAPFPAPDSQVFRLLYRRSNPDAMQLEIKGHIPPANRFLSLVQDLEAQDMNGREVKEEPGQKPGVHAFHVTARRPLTLTKWVYVEASPDALPRETLRHLAGARKKGLETLTTSHRKAWEKLWESDVRIGGDMEAQQAVRSSLFYLLSSVREGGSWSIPPMGLSGVQWGGHIFWDADTWMYPVLGLLHPELARPIVDYRYDTLDGARWNARKNGYRGADYATESAVTGREIAPVEFPFHDQTSADVAVAQWRQFLLSGDRRRLEEKAYPILKDAADYYASRATFNKAKDRYEIRRVISPDETASYVDNDVYTNAAAKTALQAAIQASRLLGKPVPPEWGKVADKLWIPMDLQNRRYLEHEGYVKTRRKPKQADAQLVLFPLEYPTPDDMARNTMAFYAPNVSPIGPAMTASVHAVIAARLAAPSASTGAVKNSKPNGGEWGGVSGDWGSQAYHYFQESYRPFLRSPLNDFSEKRTTNNTTFLTGCAGVLLAPLYGFGGIRYDANGISARPYLPPRWKRLTVTGIHYRGKVYDLDVAQGKLGELKARTGPH